MAGNEAVRGYIDGVDSAHRPLFDRVHQLIMAAHPDADDDLDKGHYFHNP